MNFEANAPGPAGLPAHERTYRALRDLLLFGEIPPGESVTIQGLTDRLDVGMTPAREALRRLTAEGALLALGNRRIMVPVLDEGALTELTEARLALEPRLAVRAVTRIKPTEIEELRLIDKALDGAIAQGDVPGYLRGNHAFHARLNAVAQAPILTALVETLWLRFGPSLRIVCGQMGTRNLPDRHKDLLQALSNGCADSARLAMEGDISQGMGLISQSLGQS